MASWNEPPTQNRDRDPARIWVYLVYAVWIALAAYLLYLYL